MDRLGFPVIAFAVSVAASVPAQAAPPGAPRGTASPAAAPNIPSPPRAFNELGPEPGFRPNVRAAMAVGLFTMLIPGFIGGTRAALGESDGDKTAGLLVASGGLALAPIFSHMITHEWERAAQFGAVPFLSTVLATAYISQKPTAVFHGDMLSRTTFGALLGISLLSGVVGIVDTALAGERAKEREKSSKTSLFIAPSFSQEGATLTFGGAL